MSFCGCTIAEVSSEAMRGRFAFYWRLHRDHTRMRRVDFDIETGAQTMFHPIDPQITLSPQYLHCQYESLASG